MGLQNVEVKECPYCGGTEFGEGYQRGYAKIVAGVFNLGGDNLYHIICMNCGSVVRSYVRYPDRFKK